MPEPASGKRSEIPYGVAFTLPARKRPIALDRVKDNVSSLRSTREDCL